MRKIGLIGFGSIGAAIVDSWSTHLLQREQLAAILVRPRQLEQASRRAGPAVRVVAQLDAFLACDLDVVVEAAGHGAVSECAEAILRRGCELHILSTGALADDGVRARIQSAATQGRTRVVIPAGAFAGFDGLLTLRAAGLVSVKYTTVKPIAAWRGTPAEAACDLDLLASPRVVFSGTAGQAAISFPRNANLAAAVALAGMGFDKTRVELIADPHSDQNIARLEAVCALGKLDVSLSGTAFRDNPKTSHITAMSAIAALLDAREQISFR